MNPDNPGDEIKDFEKSIIAICTRKRMAKVALTMQPGYTSACCWHGCR
jgi:hypothetical protein